jgi:hypothetical protein
MRTIARSNKKTVEESELSEMVQREKEHNAPEVCFFFFL